MGWASVVAGGGLEPSYVVGENAGSKQDKALELEVPVLDEDVRPSLGSANCAGAEAS
jgi:hypothetical protein